MNRNSPMRRGIAMLLILSTVSFSGCKKEKRNTKYIDLFPYAETEYFTPFQNEKTSYCSLDEGLDLPVYTQGMSGCFAFSAVTSVQAYLQKNKIGNWEATGEEIFDRMYCAKEDLSSGKDGMYATIGNKTEYGGNPLHVFDVLCSDPLHGYVLSDAIRLINPGVDELKEWVREYGAPVVAISLESGYSRSHGYPTQNYKGTETNHFLCVIGWDDDFPADAFSTKASRNGAWLVQNTITPLNIPAYYWVSYDVQFPLAISYQMTNSYSSGETHGYAMIGNIDLSRGSGESAYGSIIRHEGNLSAVGIFSEEETCTYEVEILDGNFGRSLSKVSGKMERAGYHLVKLDTPLSVQECTVVIRKTGTVYFEGESMTILTKRFFYSGAVEGELEYVTHTEPNTSFVLVDGKWIDVTDESLSEKLGVSEYTKMIGDPFLPVLFS
ncbi:MAG: hypothetical protein IKM88_08985 [Lachnospiraceae bacterium]|nr:hypothetical protein [Lachnospiraceae bacterium]